MKMRIKEFSKLTGVSVRTLHYYDEIGLLKPAFVDRSTGYRYYDQQSLLRMQQILFYRELDFSLKSIEKIVSSPDYDTKTSLEAQRKLLTLKKERLERLIASIDDAMKGENVMHAFDNTEFETYKEEAKEKWGNTDAYQEHREKTRNYSKEKWNGLAGEMDQIMAAFADCLRSGTDATAFEAQQLVKKLQDHITGNYYHCTNEILAGLGQMYVADARFQHNIDQHGEGTAAFVCRAIEAYCHQ
jgi:DNA-binding transcriptional MerR regulator